MTMTQTYRALTKKQLEESEKFPMVFAFSNEQFESAMKKLGLTKNDTNKIYSVGGGGFIRRTDAEALSEMRSRHDNEMNEAIEGDLTGEGFIKEMFSYELANHEYSYTGDIEPALDALGLTVDKVNADKRLLRGLKMAINEQR